MEELKKVSKSRKRFKRSKIFQERNFDSNDQSFEESDITEDFNLSRQSLNKNIEKVNVTPSKSEFTIEDDLNESSVLDSFKLDDDNDSKYHDSVLDVFADDIPMSSPKMQKKRKKIESIPEIVDSVEISSETNYQPVASYADWKNDRIVVLKENDQIYFYGFATVSVLHGTIEIFGAKIDHLSNANIYSFRGSSLLYIKNITKSATLFQPNLKKFPKSLNVQKNSAVLLVKKLIDCRILFVEKYISQQILPKCDENLPRIIFEPRGDWNLLSINHQWESIIGVINKETKMLICGGKGVGKSTFLRYTINRLLEKFPKVRVIDLDPGQSEFTVPGCISIITVKDKLLGPNFSHLQQSDKSLLSNINVNHDPVKYIKTIEYLLRDYQSDYPTLINYMGYTHGLGIHILSAVAYILRPTDILQITSENPKSNFKFKLSPNIIADNARFFIPDCYQKNLEYNLIEIISMSDNNSGWTAEPRQLREMCILSYFGKMVDETNISIYNPNVPMYEIDLKDIDLYDADGLRIPPDAINATIVALCTVDLEAQLFICFGWGIVRGVNSEILVLITPEDPEILEKVDCLVSNGFTLPPSIYMTPDESLGNIPYANKGDLMNFGLIPKRSHLSVKK